MEAPTSDWKGARANNQNEKETNYETQFFKFVNRWKYLLGWSLERNHSIGYRLYSGVTKFLIALLFCSEVWELTEATTVEEIMADLNVIVIQMITLYRYKNWLDNKEIYTKLATSMDSIYFDTKTTRRKELVKLWAERNEKFFKWLFYFVVGIMSAWIFFPLLDDFEYNLMMPARMPVDYRSSVRYPIFYLLTGYPFISLAMFVVTSDLTVQTYLIHLLCQYIVLQDCFVNIIDDCINDDHEHDNVIVNEVLIKKYMERLNELVVRHEFILRNTVDLKNSLSLPLLGQMSASTVLICSTAFQATTALSMDIIAFLTILNYFIYALIELFIFCKWCDEITTQSENIAESVYFSGWEKGLSKIAGVRASILIIMTRSKYPMTFTAGGIFDVTLTSYTKLVKTSYSAFTLLRRFQQ